MKIEFVCTGNTFRSRMAEAYLKSKKIQDLIITSSGIEANKNLNGSICDYTISVLNNHNIINFVSSNWKLTEKIDLENQDIVIFMDENHKEFCFNKLACNILNFEIWNIADIPDDLIKEKSKNYDTILKVAEIDFEIIKVKIDDFIKRSKLKK